MKVNFTTDKPGACPEGVWRGALVSAREPKQRIKRACPTQIQLTFLIEHPQGEFIVYGKFCADASWNSELHDFMQTWLGDKLERYVDDDGGIDFDLLMNKEADLVIQHHQEEGYSRPFVKIAGAFPPGTLLEDE